MVGMFPGPKAPQFKSYAKRPIQHLFWVNSYTQTLTQSALFRCDLKHLYQKLAFRFHYSTLSPTHSFHLL